MSWTTTSVIPLATTTVSILRRQGADEYEEPYGGGTPAGLDVAASGVRAVIGRPRGSDRVEGGEQARTELELLCDPCDVVYTDLVKDESTGVVYRLTFLFNYPDHVEGRLELVQGVV